MSIVLYNTLTRTKEPFVPQVPGQVSMYVCGVTVYDRCHMGHARAYVAFDTIRRFLMAEGLKVTYVQNFTDIDDKIIQRAAARGIATHDLVTETIQSYYQDIRALNILDADIAPRATEHIDTVITIIQELIDQGVAYTLNGDVCFSVKKCQDYGKLSRKKLDDLISGIRVDVNHAKQDPLDFVLWKAAKPGEPYWDSPWGPGRPGWHIECSAMVRAIIGDTVDIHGGGEDLIFPHHENEIAQSECAHHYPLAKYWIHNGFVTINEEKMSKSLGNFFSIRDVLEQYSGEVIRFFLLKTHYRKAVSFSNEALEEAKQGLTRLRTTLETVQDPGDLAGHLGALDSFKYRFFEAMRDDFNYAEAIGILFEVSKYANTHQAGVGVLRELGEILGLFFETSEADFPEEVVRLVEERIQCRKDRNFARADEIRDVLLIQFGVVIEDSADGIRLKRQS